MSCILIQFLFDSFISMSKLPFLITSQRSFEFFSINFDQLVIKFASLCAFYCSFSYSHTIPGVFSRSSIGSLLSFFMCSIIHPKVLSCNSLGAFLYFLRCSLVSLSSSCTSFAALPVALSKYSHVFLHLSCSLSFLVCFFVLL